MKKFLVLSVLILAGLCAFALEKEYTYSPKYVNHLKVCAKYTDVYNTTISTGDVNSPYLRLKSTEEIHGWLNGKCRTTSSVYSYDLDKEIMNIKCRIPRAKLSEMIEKMREVNNSGTPESKKVLQAELTQMIEDPQVCSVKNYLEDEKK